MEKGRDGLSQGTQKEALTCQSSSSSVTERAVNVFMTG